MLKIVALIAGLLFTGYGFAAENRLLDIQHWQTQKHIPVYFVASHEVPMVDILIGFYAGAVRDGGQSGLAALTNSMLASGTKLHSADAIAEQFAMAGAQYNSSLDKEVAVVSLRSLTNPRQLSAALATFSEILQQANFPEAAVKRERNNQLALLQYQQQLPDVMAEQTFAKLLYQTHPYANPVLGQPDTVAKLSRQEVVKFYQRYYVAQNAMIIIVGDQTLAQAKTLAEQLSDKLPHGTKAPEIAHDFPKFHPQIKDIRFPTEQTHLVMGQPAINYRSPDYIPLTVANSILGGPGLTSMLFQEIRKKRGLTYGATSELHPMLACGYFVINLATRNEQAKPATEAIQQLLTTYTQQGPTAQQLAMAKQFITGNLPLRLASNTAIANALLNIAAYHLPLDFYDSYRSKVQQLDLKTVRQVWQRYIQADNLIIVRVGKHANE